MTTQRGFSIRRIQLRHYRSIGSCDVSLGPMTLLVGPNGSGKSNFIDSLRFVAQSLNENLDNALRERGGITEVRRRSTGHPNHVGVRIEFDAPGFSGTYGFKIAALAGGDYRVSHESCRVSPHRFGADDAFVEVRDGTVLSSSYDVLPRVSHDRLYLVALSNLDPFRPLYDGLTGINVYNLNPDAMRRPQQPSPGDLLARDGANIASVLEHVRRTAPDTGATVTDYLRQIVPGVESVSRVAIGNWETIEFKQSVAGSPNPWTFHASSMSDGTLRALGVLVALFATNQGLPSPVGIEEPESALHPAAAGLLLEALRGASEQRQVVATSHSPDLLDSPSINPDELLAVRADQGTTTVAPLDQASRSALRDRLYTAGELLRVDQLQPDPHEQPMLEFT